MKKIISVIIFIILIGYINVGNIYAQPASTEDAFKLLEGELNKLIQDGTVKGASAAVVQNGNVILEKGFGYADVENGLKADGRETAFRIGSVSKTFTALAALKLKEKGVLDFNKNIEFYIRKGNLRLRYPVTMQQLLTHSAGFEEKYYGIFSKSENQFMSLEKTIKSLQPDQIFIPDTLSTYSNYGISLAGYVIQELSEMSFESYVKETIFKPLGMKNTTFDQREKLSVSTSKGYSAEGVPESWEYINLYPAGSVVTTAEDMAKYMQFLLDDQNTGVLGGKYKRELFSKQYTMDNDFEGLGYTWFREKRNGHVYYSHEGSTVNFNSQILLFPDKSIGMFYTANTSSTAFFEIKTKIIDAIYGKVKIPERYDGADIADISGKYIDLRSNFTTIEKAQYIFSPKAMEITGNPQIGYSIFGQKLISVDKNSFFNEYGVEFKLLELDGKKYIVNDFNAPFRKIEWYELIGWQPYAMLLNLILSLIGIIVSLVWIFKNRHERSQKATLIKYIMILAFIGSVVFIGFIFFYFTYFNEGIIYGVWHIIFLLKAVAVMMLLSALCLIVSTYFVHRYLKSKFLKVFYYLWTFSYLTCMICTIQYKIL